MTHPKLALPRNRYWGDRKPPKNRTDMFNVSTAPRAAEDPQKGTVATIRIYGPIDSWGGFWGVSAEEVGKVLDDFGADVVEILCRINSPGGEAWEGLAIMNMLRAHPATTKAAVDGVAASAASVVAVGCDQTVMSPGTQMMIHDATTFAYGNPAEVTAALNMIVSCSNSLADLYAEAAGGSADDWRTLMKAETWYTAKEAVAAGLADDVAVVPDVGRTQTAGDQPPDVVVIPGPVEDYFDLSIYNYAGRSQAPAPAAAAAAPKPPAARPRTGHPTQEGSTDVSLSDAAVTTMRQKLGIAEDADEATILAALDEALDERAEDTPPTADNKAATVPPGMKLVSETVLTDLTEKANAGSEAHKRLHAQQRTSDLDRLRNRYPNTPEARKRWEDEYDRDPQATVDYLEKSPVVVPDAELGHGGNGDDAAPANVKDDPKFNKWKW